MTTTEPTLVEGSTGSAVVLMQTLLNEHGANPQLAEDGDFGPLTLAALNAFKTANKLTIPGVCGPVTWGVLQANVPTPPPGNNTPGKISVSQVDFTGKGSWSSGQTACINYGTQACNILGVPTQYWVPGMVTMAGRESAYNSPNWQVNTTDSNATGPIQVDGAPLNCSRGVAQCIPSTFAAYHAAGASLKIYDPVSSFAASANYVMSRYGVSRDGHDLAAKVQQFDPTRPPRGYYDKGNLWHIFSTYKVMLTMLTKKDMMTAS